MIALDTNVLVRLIVDDEKAPRQVAAARARVQAEKAVALNQCVFIETMWVLERSYGYPRRIVCDIAAQLLDHSKYVVADSALLEQAVGICRSASIGFADALALAHACNIGATLVSFDRKLSRLDGAGAV
jgi:predicted nucleic-acid-binding protein